VNPEPITTLPAVPLISTDIAVVALVGLCLAMIALFAILQARHHMHCAALGEALLKANYGDWDAAAKSVDSVRMENEAFRAGLVEPRDELVDDVRAAEASGSEFRRRQAAFNAACRETDGCAPHWRDVQ